MDHRQHPRIVLAGMVADISDGRGFYSGTVHDISRFGLAFDALPPRMNSRVDHLTAIVEGQGAHFRLHIAPRWEIVAGRQKIIGGQIEKCPFAWTEFVMRLEPQQENFWANS